MAQEKSEIAQRMEMLREEVDQTALDIERRANDLGVRAVRARRFDTCFRATTAILAVAAPAFVTYSTQSDATAVYKLVAILVSAIAGAAATLQAVFGFRQTYIQFATAELDLRDVVSELRSSTTTYFNQGDQLAAVGAIETVVANSRRAATAREFAIRRQAIVDYSSQISEDSNRRQISNS